MIRKGRKPKQKCGMANIQGGRRKKRSSKPKRRGGVYVWKLKEDKKKGPYTVVYEKKWNRKDNYDHEVFPPRFIERFDGVVNSDPTFLYYNNKEYKPRKIYTQRVKNWLTPEYLKYIDNDQAAYVDEKGEIQFKTVFTPEEYYDLFKWDKSFVDKLTK